MKYINDQQIINDAAQILLEKHIDWRRLEHDLNVGLGSIIIFSFIVMNIIEIAI